MKYIILIVVFLMAMFVGCQFVVNEEGELLELLEEKCILFKEKCSEFSKFIQEVEKFEKVIVVQDFIMVVKNRKLVIIVLVECMNFEYFVEIQVLVVVDDYINVISEVVGCIFNLIVEEGDNVCKGQLIVELDLE